eukprot:2167758-Rhodomonas_salina.5
MQSERMQACPQVGALLKCVDDGSASERPPGRSSTHHQNPSTPIPQLLSFFNECCWACGQVVVGVLLGMGFVVVSKSFLE